MRSLLILPCLLAASASPALAHVSVDPGQASAGGFQAVRFRVGHGCEDVHATTGLRVEIPAGVLTVRPQPKPGWTLTIDHDGGRVSAVTWRGDLPADEFDDFGLLMKLPAEPGVLYFPTVQTCGADDAQWTEVPDPDAPGERLTHPAPALRLLPNTASDAGHHHE